MSTKIKMLPFCSENTAWSPHKLGSPTIACKIQTTQVIRRGPEGRPSTFSSHLHSHTHSQTPPGGAGGFTSHPEGLPEISRRFLNKQMLTGKENGGIPRKIPVQVYLFITRKWVYTDPPQEIHFLYIGKFHFLFLLRFQTYMRRLSATICNKNPWRSLRLHSCRSPGFFKKTFIKSVLTNLKSLSVQIIPGFHLPPS